MLRKLYKRIFWEYRKERLLNRLHAEIRSVRQQYLAYEELGEALRLAKRACLLAERISTVERIGK